MEEKNEWVVRVDEEAQYITLTDTDDTISRLKKCSIYRVPAAVVNLNREAYLPKWVSFGPYHHGEEHLKPMEEHKHRALLYTLKRYNQKLQSFVRAVEEIADDLLDSYQSLEPYWRENRDVFVKLMILDGCFMLEIMRKETTNNDYPPSDPVFGKHGEHHIFPYIRRDMILLENQLPFLLLKKLGAVVKEDEKFVNNLIIEFYSSGEPVTIMDGCLHMVHLYKRLFWKPSSRSPSRSNVLSIDFVRSATDHSKDGIIFKKSDTDEISDVTFRNGILRLPSFYIYEPTESMFLNILAFERLHVGAGSEVTTYVKFMSRLVKNVKDVSLLRSEGIILNTQDNDPITLQLFDSLSKGLAFDPDNNLYGEVIYLMCHYPYNGWPRYRSTLLRTYIRHWPVLSTAFAALLAILTIIQTVYTVYSAY